METKRHAPDGQGTARWKRRVALKDAVEEWNTNVDPFMKRYAEASARLIAREVAKRSPSPAVSSVVPKKKSPPKRRSPLLQGVEQALLNKPNATGGEIRQWIDDYWLKELADEFKTKDNSRGSLAMAYKQSGKHRVRIDQAISTVRSGLKKAK